jgi:TRAP-type C4-dicarboxylate transport system substrate-binding protein
MRLATSLLALGLAAGLSAGLAAPVAAQDKTVEWKYSHWVPATHPLQGILQAWAKSIDEASKGTIKISIFPAQQLGKAPDHYDMVQKGIADVAYVSTGYQAGRMLVTSVAQMPFMLSNAEGGSKAFDEWYRPYAAKDMPGVKLCYMYTHDVATLHSKKEIRTPDQIKGMKIRPAHATMAQWMTSLGATTVQVSAPESREALERGVADAITFPWGSLISFKIDGITKFHIDEPLYVATFATVINEDKYAALSADQKKVIDAHCTTEWAGKTAGEWAKVEDDGRQKLRAAGSGHTNIKLKPEELALWRKSAEPVMAKWLEDMKAAGHDGPKVLADFKAALKKYNALAD